jgi:hypothetical protein
MSTPEAKKTIEKMITQVLEAKSPRTKLDETFHVLDLSYDHLLKFNKLEDEQLAKESYVEFIIAVEQLTKKAYSLDAAIAASRNNKNIGPQFIEGVALLICLNFGAARRIITQVSHSIPDNEYFGISYREKTLTGTKYAYKLEEGSSLIGLKGKSFLLDNGRVGTVTELNTGKRTKFELVENTNLGPYTHVLVPLPPPNDSAFKLETISDHRGAQLANTDGTVTLGSNKDSTIGPIGDFPKLKREWLSKLDIGHLFKKNTRGGRTPLGDRLQKALVYKNLSSSARDIVQKYINKLDKAHGEVTYVFHNTAPDSTTKLAKTVGIVVLSVQFFELNNALAADEAKIKREITEEFKNIAANLKGSNTIIEDIVENTRNKIVSALSGKVKVLKKHSPVKGSVPMRDKTLPKPTNTEVKGTSKNKISSNKTIVKVVKESTNISTNTVNLTSLQSLINQHLQNVISANMGSGTEKRILNYRTGRFAASAKVESMSQSRQGMITAFYSYMKNPYQTFEPGFKQGSPKTRDPKLLISQSIREIAATKVGNQLRAQAI